MKFCADYFKLRGKLRGLEIITESPARRINPPRRAFFPVWLTMILYWGVVKCKPSALFRNLCDSCKSVHVLLLLSCVHSLGLGLDLGNSLDQREGENARALIA